jgi:hypothetical protein
MVGHWLKSGGGPSGTGQSMDMCSNDAPRYGLPVPDLGGWDLACDPGGDRYDPSGTGSASFVSAAFRRQHNDIAAAILSIIGVTYAVLLALVAMLAWDGFNKAKAVSHLEAVLVLDLIEVADGLTEPAKANLLDGMKRYTRAVIAIEWPAQAEGHVARAGDRFLDCELRAVR